MGGQALPSLPPDFVALDYSVPDRTISVSVPPPILAIPPSRPVAATPSATMDHCAQVLLAFPSEVVLSCPSNVELYENALRTHCSRVEKLFKDHGAAISANALALLEVSLVARCLHHAMVLLTSALVFGSRTQLAFLSCHARSSRPVRWAASRHRPRRGGQDPRLPPDFRPSAGPLYRNHLLQLFYPGRNRAGYTGIATAGPRMWNGCVLTNGRHRLP